MEQTLHDIINLISYSAIFFILGMSAGLDYSSKKIKKALKLKYN